MMKTHANMFLTVALAAVTAITLLCGCATQLTVPQKESMLVAAGFKALPATTPDQQRLLKSLPNNQVSPINRYGKVYFAFPDRSRKVLYVGQEAQYLSYQAKVQAQSTENYNWNGGWAEADF